MPKITTRSCLLSFLLLLVSTFVMLPLGFSNEEIQFPSEDFKKLDTFEALNLEDADKLYNNKDYRGAFAAYKAYSFEFPQSRSLPYVLLRMGRCLHQLEKRNAAIKAYQDVVDYFPDSIRYAAGALFYIGQCHGQNGDDDKQTAVWARMVKDNDYVSQPNSGTALTHLADVMEGMGNYEEAVEYHWRTAISFIKSNPRAAADARSAVIYHYVIRNPNHEKLSEFYIETNGFGGDRQINNDVAQEPNYWTSVLTKVQREAKGEEREPAAAYWTAKMGKRFSENERLRKQWCDVQLIHEKNADSWLARMDELYKSKPATLERILKWCDYYEKLPEVQSKFFAEEAGSLISGLNTEEKFKLMGSLMGLRMNDEVRSLMRQINTRELTDEELLRFVGFAQHYEPEDVIMRYLDRLNDPLTASKERYDYYKERRKQNRGYTEKALAEIPKLRKSPKYAGEQLSWAEGNLLRDLGRYEEAIKAYRNSNRQPDATWAIAGCLKSLKRYSEAVKNLREIEAVGGDVASRACLEIAKVYRAAGDKAREVDQLRIVLKRYPKSSQSSEAHRTLEGYGVALIGGQSEADD